MKRLFFAVVAVLFLAGCTPAGETPPGDAQTPAAAQTELAAPAIASTPTPNPCASFEPWENYEDEIPMICFDIGPYDTLDKLISVSDCIAVAGVVGIDVFALPPDPEHGSSMLTDTLIRYTIEIEETVTGDITPGSAVSVWQEGWRYGQINLAHPTVPPLSCGKTYLLSFSENSYPVEGLNVDYRVGMPLEAYPEILNGWLIPYPGSGLFRSGQSAQSAIDALRAAHQQQENYAAAQTGLSAEQGAAVLAERLSADPDAYQEAVHTLTPEEIAAVTGDLIGIPVLQTAGRALKNGDLFVWIKTDKLTRAQQSDLEDALNTAAAAAAEQADLGFQASVYEYHSLVALSRGEDKATILAMFHDIVRELGA